MLLDDLSGLSYEDEVSIGTELVALVTDRVSDNGSSIESMYTTICALYPYNYMLAVSIREALVELYGDPLEEVGGIDTPTLKITDTNSLRNAIGLLDGSKCSNYLIGVCTSIMDFIIDTDLDTGGDNLMSALFELLEGLKSLMSTSVDAVVLMLSIELIASLECQLEVGLGTKTVEELMQEPFSDYVKLYLVLSLITARVRLGMDDVLELTTQQGLKVLVGKFLRKLESLGTHMTPLERFNLTRLSQYWLQAQLDSLE